MKHLSEELLILHYYGELDSGAHLASCELCRAELAKLTRTLDAFDAYPVPERGSAYETLVWQRISPNIRRQAPAWWRRPMVLAPVLAGLVVAAFFAGRISNIRRAPVTLAADTISESGRRRIFLVALDDHLRSSQMVLLEVANSGPDGLDSVRERAQELAAGNRLYRQTADLEGITEFNPLLDELGRVLADIANAPPGLSPASLRDMRQRIETGGLIFKIRVVNGNLDKKESERL